MKCDHCGSMMVVEKVCNKAGQSESWRCILCGEYVDQVILENRQYQKTIQENSPKKKGGQVEEPREHQAVSLATPDVMDWLTTG